MRKQYANRSAKLQNNTRTIKIHTEMPLAHICTRGIPIIYYQRKIYLLLIVLLIISSLSHLVVLSFCLQLPSPKASALQPTRHSRLALTNLSGSQGTVTLAHSFGVDEPIPMIRAPSLNGWCGREIMDLLYFPAFDESVALID